MLPDLPRPNSNPELQEELFVVMDGKTTRRYLKDAAFEELKKGWPRRLTKPGKKE